MTPSSPARSIAMMKAILDGETCTAVGERWGMTRSAVQQRVRALALELQAVVGVEGVEGESAPSLSALRMNQAAYREALQHYCPERRVNPARSAALSDAEIARAIAITRTRSRCRRRDVALLLVLFSTAARPLEIARLEVGDYLNADGSVREESVLRAEASVNGKSRPLFFVSRSVVTAIDAYLAERRLRGHGSVLSPAYRGLDPRSRLFLTRDGTPMPIRVRVVGPHRHCRCNAIHDIYQRIFATAGLAGIPTTCARKTVALRLGAQGCSVDQVGLVLGLSDRTAVRKLMRPGRSSPLKVAVRGLL